MKKGILSLFLLFMSISAIAQLRLNFGKDSPSRKLQIAEMVINKFYVDSVNEQKLVEDAIQGMLEKLDPHSSYSTAKETKSMNEPLQGNFDGIGVQFNMIEDTLVVIQPVVGGPSEKVGILAGDRIVVVNDTAIAGVKMDRSEIMRRLRGPKGTKVNLKIVRRGASGLLSFVVTRDKIPLKTVDAFYMIRPGVGYIRLSSFGLTSAKEVLEALTSLQKQGMNSLIFDLQENGGGFLHAAVEIAGQFLPKDDLIVYTKGRVAPREDYKALGGGKMEKGKLVILVDELSASASEIVTGAIQDHDRGIVVGRRSFGKGLVQRPINFEDGSMIRLTIAHYYTPSGRCIQKPYRKGDLKDYEMDLDKRYKHGELVNKDSIHFDETQKFYTLKKHRLVYGGGGIMPDFFVPLDTAKYSKYYRQLVLKGLVINTSLKYIDVHRKSLKASYRDFSTYQRSFKIPQELIDNIIKEGEKAGIKAKDDKEMVKSLPVLKLQLKALIARDIWDMNRYYQIINEDNDVVKKAIEVITK